MATPDVGTPSGSAQSSGVSWVVVGIIAAAGVMISIVSGTHIVLALVMIPLFIAVAWSSPRALIGLLVVWMVELGLLRRLIPGGGNATFSGDPVLIVGPIMIGFLFFLALTRGCLDRRTLLANVVLGFNVIALIEVVNPKQGPLMTGLGGLLFMLIPVLAFWVGRTLVDEDMMQSIVWAVAILSVITALYGLYQQFVGFPSWDQRWINSSAYGALDVGNGVTRSFGSMSSAQEYAAFLGLGLMAWLALLGKRTRIPLLLHLGAIVLLGVAIFYESERSEVFLCVFAMGIMAAAWRRASFATMVVAGVMAVGLLIGAAGEFGGSSTPNSSTSSASSTLASHQLTGLSDPTGSSSSFNGHVRQTERGILQGFDIPFGNGTGSVTVAASKYNTTERYTTGTEFDPGNMGEAFGVAGLLLYVLATVTGFGTAYRASRQRRDAVGYFIVGAVAVQFLQWFNGDLYSVTWLVWLVLGFADAYLIGGMVHTDELALEAEPAPRLPKSQGRWIQPA